MGLDAMVLVFECWVLSQLFHSPLSPSPRGSLVPFHFLSLEWYHLHIWGYWYFSWKSWFHLMIHPARHFAWCILHIRWQYTGLSYSFPNFESVVPCLVLTITSWPACRFLRRQIRWYGIPISLRVFQLVVIHTVKSFRVVNEAEIDVFLKLPCFLHDPTNVDNHNRGSKQICLKGLGRPFLTVRFMGNTVESCCKPGSLACPCPVPESCSSGPTPADWICRQGLQTVQYSSVSKPNMTITYMDYPNVSEWPTQQKFIFSVLDDRSPRSKCW